MNVGCGASKAQRTRSREGMSIHATMGSSCTCQSGKRPCLEGAVGANLAFSCEKSTPHFTVRVSPSLRLPFASALLSAPSHIKHEKKHYVTFKGMIQTVRTIEELSGISFLTETHPGSCCYRVHDPILAFARTALLGPPRHRRGEESGEGRKPGAEEGEGARDGEAPTRTSTAAAAVVASQARYLGRVNTLLRFSGGGSGTNVGEAEAARRCGEMVALGGLPALAALWQALEGVRSEGGRGRDPEGEALSAEAEAATGPLLEGAYGAALEGMGVCVEAASGYWAAAKLMQLRVRTERELIVADTSAAVA